MQGQSEYEVWKLVENQGRCYASTDLVEGLSLAAYLKYQPILPRELLLRLLKEIPRELDKFHRCRGNPCFQYVNPFSIIISLDENVHLLNLESEKQKELLKKMRRREVRESFQREDNRHYQRASLADDIYSLGRTYQYVFAAADTSPPIRGMEKRRMRRIIAACLSQDPGRETERRIRKQYQNFQEISDQFPKVTDKHSSKKGGVHQKDSSKKRIIPLLAAVLIISMISICAGKAVLEKRASSRQNPENTGERVSEDLTSDETKVRTESQSTNQSIGGKISREREGGIKSQEEKKLAFDLGLLYFLELEDYEKSGEIFAEMADEDSLAASYEKLSHYLASEEKMTDEEVGNILAQIEEEIPDEEDFRYYFSLLRGYRFLTGKDAKERIIDIGEYCLKLEEWKEDDGENKKQKEILGDLAAAYGETGKNKEAISDYGELLELEEDPAKREILYEKLVLLYEKDKNQEKAWEICGQGIEELKDSAVLRIQFIRMQCQNSGTSREVCAQTIQKYLKELPEIASDEEFKKLQQTYDIKVEGEKVWVGK